MSITHGNTKLGMLIWGWSIPAMALICIGATSVCRKLCYALKGFFYTPSVKKSHLKNYEESLEDDFPMWMTTDIRRNYVQVVRVHVGGDFYSVEYVLKWLKVCANNPDTLFYAYTRTWRDPELRRFLLRLARRPNFYMWWSCDRETGKPPKSKFVRTAYLMENDSDEPRYKVDLVFRDDSSTVMKYTSKGYLICPYDNGVTKTTCSACKICFTDRKANYGKRPEKKLAKSI